MEPSRRGGLGHKHNRESVRLELPVNGSAYLFLLLTASLFINVGFACHGGNTDNAPPGSAGVGGVGEANGQSGTGGVADAGGKGGTVGTEALLSCEPGATLTGATYDISRSHFAFGSPPIVHNESGVTRWEGIDGVVMIAACGLEMGAINGSADGQPDWSSDSAALSAHVIDYFVSMGVEECQIMSTSVNASSGGGCSSDGSCEMMPVHRYILLNRGVDNIAVLGSTAWARFNVNDQSTSEEMYWPTVPADTVLAARSFRDALADPAKLAIYKSKLPANAQGEGRVVIHHTTCLGPSSTPFQSAATYDVLVSSMDYILSFNAEGDLVTTIW